VTTDPESNYFREARKPLAHVQLLGLALELVMIAGQQMAFLSSKWQ